jgi:hypothetical protein
MRLDAPRTLLAAGTMLALACGATGTPATASASAASTDRTATREDEDRRPHFLIVPPQARVAGKTTLEWIPDFWRYLMSLPADVNPELNLSADCSVGQSGPVFFLPGFQARVSTRSCTIPAHTPVMYTFQSLFNDYPCPDPSFQPAPGQTLEDFLAQGAKAFDDAITNMAVTIDGTAIDPDRYRYLTGLFSFTGDPSLTASFDSCVTGSEQVAVVDGWFVLLRLSPGDHTLVTTYVNPGGHPTSATFLLHVLGEPEQDD